MKECRLRSAVVEFEPLQPFDFAGVWSGQYAHASLFEQCSRFAPELAREIHDLPGRKPFTVSPVMNSEGKPVSGVEPGNTYRIRYTTLTEQAAAMLDVFEPADAGTFRLHARPMVLKALRREGVPWTRDVGFVRFSESSLEKGDSRGARIRMRFATPTRCNSATAGDVLFPSPQIILRGLSEKWVLSSEGQSGLVVDTARNFLADGGRAAAASIEVDSYSLETTRPARFSKRTSFRKSGYVGEVTYVARKDADPLALRMATMLCEFSYWAGTGYHATMGLGQTFPDVVQQRSRRAGSGKSEVASGDRPSVLRRVRGV